MKRYSFTTRITAIILAFAITGPMVFSVLLVPKPTYAQLGGGEDTVPTHCSDSDFNCTKEGGGSSITGFVTSFLSKLGIDDTISRLLARVFLEILAEQTVKWVTKAGGKEVGYITNYEKTFRNLLQKRGAEFLGKLGNATVNTDISSYLTEGLKTPSLSQIFGPSPLDPIIDYAAVYTGKGTGDWSTFIHMSVNPKVDPVGGILVALDEKIGEEKRAAEATIRKALNNEGYLGVRAETLVCDVLGCITEEDTLTPGSVISESLKESLKLDFAWGESTDEIGELIIQVAKTLLSSLMNSEGGIFGLSGGGGGPGGMSGGSSAVVLRVLNDALSKVNALITLINTKIAEYETALARVNARIAEIDELLRSDPGNEALIAERAQRVTEAAKLTEAIAKLKTERTKATNIRTTILGLIDRVRGASEVEVFEEVLAQVPGLRSEISAIRTIVDTIIRETPIPVF